MKTPETLSPAQKQKDAAITIARRVIRDQMALSALEAVILARQLLRELALPENG